MSSIPWNSIAESIINLKESRLNHSEALVSPCASCSTAPCCTHLPLHTFKITNMIELDHAAYVLNFDRIELGLSASGEWSVYYTYPCRFLDRHNFTCTVHNTPTQPQICVNYNPYHCWYKRVLTRRMSDDFIRIDRQSFEFILSQIVFDEARNIIEVPDWDTLKDGVANLPLEPNRKVSEPSAEDPVMAEWQRLIINLNGAAGNGQETYSYEARRDPCNRCQAYCCQILVFPQSLPGHISTLDFFRFCLGFPGVELGIADDSWSLLVRTTCQHLQANRCTIFGQPERPLICKYYDAWKCTYKSNFGLPRPDGFLRVTLDQFQWLVDCFRFDQNGQIVQFPSTEAIRQSIEERWRHELTASPAESRAVPLEMRFESGDVSA